MALQPGTLAYRPGLMPRDRAVWHPQCGSGVLGCTSLAALHLVNIERKRAVSKNYTFLMLNPSNSGGGSYHKQPRSQSVAQTHATSGGHMGSSRSRHNSRSKGPFPWQRHSATAVSHVRSTSSKACRQQAQSAHQAVGPATGRRRQSKCGSAFLHVGWNQ